MDVLRISPLPGSGRRRTEEQRGVPHLDHAASGIVGGSHHQVRISLLISTLPVTYSKLPSVFQRRGDLGARGVVPVLQGPEGSEAEAEGGEARGGQEGRRGQGHVYEGPEGRARLSQGEESLPVGAARTTGIDLPDITIACA